jgi:hypothetical protein
VNSLFGVSARTAFWGALAALCAANVLGAQARPDLFVPEGRLQPGLGVRVRWTPLQMAQAAAAGREMELVLSLDGGATFPVRVTDAIALDASEWIWTVPALASEDARLALRIGEAETEDSEQIVLLSGSFSIEASADREVEPLFLVGSQWRTRNALEGSPARSAPVAPQVGGGERLARAGEDEPGAEAPVFATERPDEGRGRPSVSRPALAREPRPSLNPPSATVPLRL